MKKILALAAITSLLISQTAFATVQYLDVDGNYKYSSDISFLSNQNIVQGYADSEFKPNKKLNRAELLKIVILGLGGVTENDLKSYEGKSCFKDVPSNEWYAKYVCYAKAQGIVKGNPDGNFKPANKINLVEALKITLKTLGASFEEGTPWYKDLTEIAADGHIIPLSFAGPQQEVTRGQMANLLHRAMKSKFMDPPYPIDGDGGNPFTSDYVTYAELTDNYVDCYGEDVTNVSHIIEIDSKTKASGTINYCTYDKWGNKKDDFFGKEDKDFLTINFFNGETQNLNAPEIIFHHKDARKNFSKKLTDAIAATGANPANVGTDAIFPLNWDKLVLNGGDNDLEKGFVEANNFIYDWFTIEKVTVDEKPALRVKYDYFEDFNNIGDQEGVAYFIPNAIGDYHLEIRTPDAGIKTEAKYSTPVNTITELDEFVNNFRF